MKSYLILLLFCFSYISVFSQTDTLEVAQKKNSYTKVRLAAHASYLNYNNQLQPFEIGSDFKPGFSVGLSINWHVSPFNKIRFEPYYFYQQIENRFNGDNVEVVSTFTNHVAGADFFPIVLKTKGKFQPTLSLGGYFQYHISYNTDTKINGFNISYPFEELNEMQYGWVVGAGFYLNRTLIELRLYNSMVEFYPNADVSNSLRSIAFIIAF